MARPRKPLDEQRTRRVAVYFTDAEYRAIYRESQRKGLPPRYSFTPSLRAEQKP